MARPKKETGNVVPGFSEQFERRVESMISKIGGLEKAASASGASVAQLTSWKFGRSRPDFFALVNLCNAAGEPIDRLAIAVEAKRAPSEHLSLVSRDALDGYAIVPELDVQASAGAGVLVDGENEIGQVAFHPQWLRERHINPAGARILTAKGDSMEPTIRNGDTLIVDTSIEMAVDSAIYVVVYAGMLLVKRVFLKRDGALVLSSDNQDRYSLNEEIPASEADQLHVAGRVMWYGRGI